MQILLFASICLISTIYFFSNEAIADEAEHTQSAEVQFIQLELISNGDFEEFEDEFSEEAIIEIFDPLSPYNRLMTRFNIKLFDWVLEPTARGYNNIMPRPGRIAVSHFFNNLLFPIRFVNNLLQFKGRGASIELARFTVNTTIGLLGFFDPAQSWLNLKPHKEDFGQTLGYYGTPSIFHIVLPVFGPSNLRDTVGMAADRYLTYSTYVFSDDSLSGVDNYGRLAIGASVESFERLNDTSLHLAEIASLKKDALDIYILTRDAYEQNRKMKIKD